MSEPLTPPVAPAPADATDATDAPGAPVTRAAPARDVRTAAMVLALAVAVGIAGALCDVSPTGSRGPDVTVTFVVAAFVAWAAATAPWWSITAAGLIATIGTAFGPW